MGKSMKTSDHNTLYTVCHTKVPHNIVYNVLVWCSITISPHWTETDRQANPPSPRLTHTEVMSFSNIMQIPDNSFTYVF